MAKVKDGLKKTLGKKTVTEIPEVKKVSEKRDEIKNDFISKVKKSFFTWDKLKPETLKFLESVKVTSSTMKARIGLAYENNGKLTQNDIRSRCGDTCSQMFNRLVEIGVASHSSDKPYKLCFNAVNKTVEKKLEILQTKKSIDANASLRYANETQLKLLAEIEKKK